jgi:hypothetical protein
MVQLSFTTATSHFFSFFFFRAIISISRAAEEAQHANVFG